MSSTITRESEKEAVKDRTDIVELASQYFETKRAGVNYVGLCPFHADKRPSLHINPARQIWKCWPCDIGGDCFDLVMRCEGLGFREALEKLADRAGVTLSQSDPARAGKRKAVLDVLKEAANLFHANLGGESLEYLKKRGMASAAKEWQLGYAPNDFNYLVQKIKDTQLLIDAGLCKKTDKGKVYDFFRGRLIFPICDPQGKVVGFGARVLPSTRARGGKYINSPETEVFSKKKHLYGIHLAAREIQKTKLSVVMEGYTDVLAAHIAGIKNAVACLGVAMGEDHIRKLQQVGDQIAIVLDGDEAGQKSMDRILPQVVGINSKVVTVPNGADPAEYIASGGPGVFRDLVKSSPNPIAWKARRVFRGFDPRKDHGKTRDAIKEVMQVFASSNEIVREQAILEISDASGIAREAIKDSLGKKKPLAKAAPIKSSVSRIEMELLEIVVCDKNVIPVAIESIDPALLGETTKQVFEFLEQSELEGKSLEFKSLVAHASENIKSVLSEAAFSAESKLSESANSELRLAAVARKLARKSVKRTHRRSLCQK